jgi:hypothetical protein
MSATQEANVEPPRSETIGAKHMALPQNTLKAKGLSFAQVVALA